MEESEKQKTTRLMKFWGARLSKMVIIFILIAICIMWSILSPAFLTANNLLLVVKQVTIYGILAVGMTFVIISGGIDLSVGANVALCGVVAAKCMTGSFANAPLIFPFVTAIISGMLVGLVNGLGVAYAKIPNFITTMCTMMIVRGLGLVITNARPVFGMRREFINISNGFLFRVFGEDGSIEIYGIPNLVFYFLGVMILGIIVLQYTTYGRKVYSIGGNMAAASYSGINVKLVGCSVYVISGFLSGLCGVLMASRISSGNATTADGYELKAIAAAVIGGISMTGGVGTLYGTLIGVLIIGVISNGMDILGVSPYFQQIIQGVIILIAVFFDARLNKK